MKTASRYGRLLLPALVLGLSANPTLPQASGAETPKQLEFNAEAMTRLSLLQRIYATLLHDAKGALDKGQDPAAVAKTFYTEASQYNLPSPLIELGRLRTRLYELGLADAVLGAKFPEGGTPVERALLVYRRDLSLTCARDAAQELTDKKDKVAGKIYLAKLGKWASQKPEALTLSSDLDLCFIGSKVEGLPALRDRFSSLLRERSGLSLVANDKVVSTKGTSEHLLYLNAQTRQFDDATLVSLSANAPRILLFDPSTLSADPEEPVSAQTASTVPSSAQAPTSPASQASPEAGNIVVQPVAQEGPNNTSPAATHTASTPPDDAHTQPEPQPEAPAPQAQTLRPEDLVRILSEAKTAERKRDFAAAAILYGSILKVVPENAVAARALETLSTYRDILEKLKAKQSETNTALAANDLDAANAAMSEVRRIEPALPGLPSEQTATLSQKVFQAQTSYQAEIGPKRSAILNAYTAGKIDEAKRLLTELTRSRPLKKDDASWAKNMATQVAQRIQQITTKNAGSQPATSENASAPTQASTTIKTPPAATSSSSAQNPLPAIVPSATTVAKSTPPAPKPLAATSTAVASAAKPTIQTKELPPSAAPVPANALPSPSASTAAPRPGAPKAIPLPLVSGQGGDFTSGLGSVWTPTSAAGGDFSRHAHFEGSTLLVDVPAGSSWGKAGIVTKEPTFIMGDEPVAVKMTLDPERTSGFGIAFAAGAYQDVWGANNIWFTYTRPSSQLQANFSFLNTQNPGDGLATASLSGRAPEELIFILRPGFAEVHLSDGRVYSIHPSWLRKGTPVFAHVFSHPNEQHLPAKLALRSLCWGPSPSFPAAVTSIPSLGSRALWTGELAPVWTQLQAAGGDYAQFARIENKTLVVKVPAGHGWGKTGVFSPERLLTLDERPVQVVVRVDPTRSTGFAVVFAPGGYNDVWGANNLWLTYTRPSSQVHGDIWFGNTQNSADAHLAEQVPGTAPYELVFTLSIGHAELRLPDGRVRSVDISWLKKDTPIFAHVFSHPNENQLPCSLALTGFSVGIGEMPASKAAPASGKQVDTGLRNLWSGEVGGLWTPLSAAGGDYSRHARLEGKNLVVDVPAGNGWGKTGVYTPERVFTLGEKAFTVTAHFDPYQTSGYVVAFAPGAYADVWGAGNAWFSWIAGEPGKDNMYVGNTQNSADAHFNGIYPGSSGPATMQFTFRAGGGGVDWRLPDGSVRSFNFSWMTKGAPVFIHIFSHPAANGLPVRMRLQGVEVQSEFIWPPAR